MKAIKLKEGECVRVYWVDSNVSRGWFPKSAVTADIPPIRSVGWTTVCNEQLVEVCATIGFNGSKLNPLSIPWGAILKVEPVVDDAN